MSYRTPVAAVSTVQDTFQRILSAVNDNAVVFTTGAVPGYPHTLSIAPDEVVELHGPRRLRLDIRFQFAVVPAEPRRDDWRDILAAGREAFAAARIWA